MQVRAGCALLFSLPCLHWGSQFRSSLALTARERLIRKRPAKKGKPRAVKSVAVERAELEIVAARVTRTVKPRASRR